MTTLGKTRRQLHRLRRALRNAALWLDTQLAKWPFRLRKLRRSLRDRLAAAVASTGGWLFERTLQQPALALCAIVLPAAFLLAITRQPAEWQPPVSAPVSIEAAAADVPTRPIAAPAGHQQTADSIAVAAAPHNPTTPPPEAPLADSGDNEYSAAAKPSPPRNVSTAAVRRDASADRGAGVAKRMDAEPGDMARVTAAIENHTAALTVISEQRGATASHDSDSPPEKPPVIDTTGAHELAHYEQMQLHGLGWLEQLDELALSAGPAAAQRAIDATDSDSQSALARHRLALAWHRTGDLAARDDQLRRARNAQIALTDPVLAITALAHRAATLAQIDTAQAALAYAGVEEKYQQLKLPIQTLAAAAAIGSSYCQIENRHRAARYFDVASDLTNQLRSTADIERALRFIALHEAHCGLGERAVLRLARMADDQLKTATALTISAVLQAQDRLGAAQRASDQAYRAARAIETPGDDIRRALRWQPTES